MERQWCWRCKAVVPMFDEQESEVVRQLYYDGVKALQEYRKATGASLQECNSELLFRSLLDKHFEMTGMRVLDPHAILHHQRTRFGPACRRCGKLLRTPKAIKCFECGQLR